MTSINISRSFKQETLSWMHLNVEFVCCDWWISTLFVMKIKAQYCMHGFWSSEFPYLLKGTIKWHTAYQDLCVYARQSSSSSHKNNIIESLPAKGHISFLVKKPEECFKFAQCLHELEACFIVNVDTYYLNFCLQGLPSGRLSF